MNNPKLECAVQELKDGGYECINCGEQWDDMPPGTMGDAHKEIPGSLLADAKCPECGAHWTGFEEPIESEEEKQDADHVTNEMKKWRDEIAERLSPTDQNIVIITKICRDFGAVNIRILPDPKNEGGLVVIYDFDRGIEKEIEITDAIVNKLHAFAPTIRFVNRVSERDRNLKEAIEVVPSSPYSHAFKEFIELHFDEQRATGKTPEAEVILCDRDGNPKKKYKITNPRTVKITESETEIEVNSECSVSEPSKTKMEATKNADSCVLTMYGFRLSL